MHAITAHIKQQFPAPRSVLYATATSYCIGGAVCTYVCAPLDGSVHTYPWVTTIAIALQRLNAVLTPAEALTYATALCEASDRSQFATAWQVLDTAVQHGPVVRDQPSA